MVPNQITPTKTGITPSNPRTSFISFTIQTHQKYPPLAIHPEFSIRQVSLLCCNLWDSASTHPPPAGMKIPVVSVNPWWVNMFTTSLTWWLNPTHLKQNMRKSNWIIFIHFRAANMFVAFLWHCTSGWVHAPMTWMNESGTWLHDFHSVISKCWKSVVRNNNAPSVCPAPPVVSVSPKECFWQIEGDKSIARGLCVADAMQEHNFPSKPSGSFCGKCPGRLSKSRLPSDKLERTPFHCWMGKAMAGDTAHIFSSQPWKTILDAVL